MASANLMLVKRSHDGSGRRGPPAFSWWRSAQGWRKVVCAESQRDNNSEFRSPVTKVLIRGGFRAILRILNFMNLPEHNARVALRGSRLPFSSKY